MQDNRELELALATLKVRQLEYAEFTRYYDGKHPLNFGSEKFVEVFGERFGRRFSKLRDNLCPVVVDTPVERLEVEGFSLEGEQAEVADQVWQIWQRTRLELNAAEVHREAFKTGDSYAIVWPGRDGQARIYPQRAECVNVEYDTEDMTISRAAKCWQLPVREAGRLADERLNLYYPDRIEKYIRRGGGAWSQFMVEGEAWPLPNPYNTVPVFHFANKPGLGQFGKSELCDIAPLQDALNKSLCDMFVGGEYAALPQRWGTGIEIPIDEQTGKPIQPFQSGVERLWLVGSETAKFGQFEQARFDEFLKVQNDTRAEIARISGTPFHYLMLGQTEFPSGEAMKTAEARFKAKLKAARLRFGFVWAEVMAFALLIDTKRQVQGLTTQWVNTDPRSEREFWETGLLKKEVGASTEQVLSEGGYTAEDIKRMKEERAAEAEGQRNSALKAFDGGEVI